MISQKMSKHQKTQFQTIANQFKIQKYRKRSGQKNFTTHVVLTALGPDLFNKFRLKRGSAKKTMMRDFFGKKT